MAIADDHGIVAVRAAHASWPTMLTHKLKTLGLVQQPREIDHLRYRYACAASKTTRSRLHPIRSETWLQRYPARATTPEPNKSLRRLLRMPLLGPKVPGQRKSALAGFGLRVQINPVNHTFHRQPLHNDRGHHHRVAHTQDRPAPLCLRQRQCQRD